MVYGRKKEKEEERDASYWKLEKKKNEERDWKLEDAERAESFWKLDDAERKVQKNRLSAYMYGVYLEHRPATVAIAAPETAAAIATT